MGSVDFPGLGLGWSGIRSHINKQMHIYIYIYIYMYAHIWKASRLLLGWRAEDPGRYDDFACDMCIYIYIYVCMYVYIIYIYKHISQTPEIVTTSHLFSQRCSCFRELATATRSRRRLLWPSLHLQSLSPRYPITVLFRVLECACVHTACLPACLTACLLAYLGWCNAHQNRFTVRDGNKKSTCFGGVQTILSFLFVFLIFILILFCVKPWIHFIFFITNTCLT